MVRCNSCGGIYEPIQADGARYFHVCPPVAEYVDAQGLPIDRDTAESIVKAGGAAHVRYVPRVNHRDENTAPRRGPDGRARLKAEGLGVTEIPPRADPLAGFEPVSVPSDDP